MSEVDNLLLLLEEGEPLFKKVEDILDEFVRMYNALMNEGKTAQAEKLRNKTEESFFIFIKKISSPKMHDRLLRLYRSKIAQLQVKMELGIKQIRTIIVTEKSFRPPPRYENPNRHDGGKIPRHLSLSEIEEDRA